MTITYVRTARAHSVTITYVRTARAHSVTITYVRTYLPVELEVRVVVGQGELRDELHFGKREDSDGVRRSLH